MKIRIASIMTTAIAIAIISGPIVLSILLAHSQGVEAEKLRAVEYAHEVLTRSEAMVDQMWASFNKLQQSDVADPCSEAQLTIMRELDLVSSYIQAVGYIVDDKLLCSSLGRAVGELPLGQVDYVSRAGVRGRINVSFPFVPGQKFAVLEKNGYAVIINKDLPIDITTLGEDISLALFSPVKASFVAQKGVLKTEWIGRAGEQNQLTFFDSDYVVAIVPSQRYEMGAIAALPMAYVNRKATRLALFLVPVGFTVGICCSIALSSFLRMQQSMPTMMKNALKRKEFFLEYQPVVDLENGKWVGAEALIRWRRPSGEMVRPDIFIQTAEDGGLIRRITAYVLERVVEDARELFVHYPDFHIAINLGAEDLTTHDTVVALRRVRQQLQATPGNLMLEVTERGFLNKDIGRQILRDIREEGMLIAIDDFGTGYSSLSYLETFDLDFLKIDKSFVDTLCSESATSHVVLHIIEMAKALNLQMIAEGVETERQAKFLQARGVQYAQGWLFSRPLSMARLLECLEKADELEKDHNARRDAAPAP